MIIDSAQQKLKSCTVWSEFACTHSHNSLQTLL